MTLKLEVGKYYKTRDGRKVGPVSEYHQESNTYVVDNTNGSGFAWFSDGRKNKHKETINDLVVEWKDETIEPTCDYCNSCDKFRCRSFEQALLCSQYKENKMDTEYTPWKDLTDIEKGELLLAHHEGKVIERDLTSPFKELEPVWEEDVYPDWNPEDIYRIKPEPVVENRNIYAYCGDDSFIGTITYKDGKPDCNSIKLGEL